MSREYVRGNGRVNRLGTLGTPHRGAPLATRWLQGDVVRYGHDLAYAIADPIIFYDQNDFNSLPGIFYRVGSALVNYLGNLSRRLCSPGIGFCVYTATGAAIPSVTQLSYGSGYVQDLNSDYNLSREAQGLSSRLGFHTHLSAITEEAVK